MALSSSIVTGPPLRPIRGISPASQWVTCVDYLFSLHWLCGRQNFHNLCTTCEKRHLFPKLICTKWRRKYRTNPVTKLPQISEPRILSVAKTLSEDIGYRIVGTREHFLADRWMLQAAEHVKQNCERIVNETGRKLECEVWRQEGSGSHRCKCRICIYSIAHCCLSDSTWWENGFTKPM